MNPSMAIALVYNMTTFWAPWYVAPYVALEMLRLATGAASQRTTTRK